MQIHMYIISICNRAWENQEYRLLLRKWSCNRTGRLSKQTAEWTAKKKYRTAVFQTESILTPYDKINLSKKYMQGHRSWHSSPTILHNGVPGSTLAQRCVLSSRLAEIPDWMFSRSDKDKKYVGPVSTSGRAWNSTKKSCGNSHHCLCKVAPLHHNR